MKKFPVTAPDGEQYLVKIVEGSEGFIGRYADVSVYLKRKQWFPKKLLAGHRYAPEWFPKTDGLYDPNDPDYIALASDAIRYMYLRWELEDIRKEEQIQQAARREASKMAFEQWDGFITKE